MSGARRAQLSLGNRMIGIRNDSVSKELDYDAFTPLGHLDTKFRLF